MIESAVDLDDFPERSRSLVCEDFRELLRVLRFCLSRSGSFATCDSSMLRVLSDRLFGPEVKGNRRGGKFFERVGGDLGSGRVVLGPIGIETMVKMMNMI